MKLKILPILLLALAGCQQQKSQAPYPIIHIGDFSRPVGDPDGHFDMACEFALSKMGYSSLRGVITDGNVNGDIVAIAQLNYLTNQAVPIAFGQREEGQEPASGLLMLKKELETSAEPIAILVEGRCTEVVEAAERWPDLFREKVRGVYLSAGDGFDGPEFPMECNAALNPEMYYRSFRMPCPIYWLPCYYIQHDFTVGENGGLFTLMQGRVLNNVRPEVFNYFRSALTVDESTRWRAALEKPVSEEDRRSFDYLRVLYTTPGILHAAGATVWKDGSVKPVGEDPDKEVFRFIPVQVTCSPEGRTQWEKDPSSKTRFILEVTDTDLYEEAMTRAVAELVSWL